MEVLIDTNIVLDSLLHRQPFSQDADKIMDLCESGEVQGFLACHTFPNVFYILRKHFSVEERRDILFLLAKTFAVIGIDAEMILGITRDPDGFAHSPVQALPPHEFLVLRKEGDKS